MGVVIVGEKLTKEEIKKAREEYDNYIKITIDVDQEIVAIGGEYHADAEKILVEKYASKNSSIWGGGYYIDTKVYAASALVNYKVNLSNPSGDILDPKVRAKFIDLAKSALKNIESLI